MRRMCEGQLQQESKRRATCRSFKMHHVLPSRSARIAYHGMSIPLPVHSLYASSTNSTTDSSFERRKKAIKVDGKDSGFQSLVTTATTSSGGVTHDEDSVTSSPGVLGTRTLGEPGSVGGETNVQQDTCLVEEVSKPLASSGSQSEIDTECPSSSLPLSMMNTPKVKWSHVGRGKALRQMLETCNMRVGRGKTHNTSHCRSTEVGRVCEDTQISNRSSCMEPDLAVSDVTEDKDSEASGNIDHELLSMRTSGITSEVCVTHVGSDHRLESNNQQSNALGYLNQCPGYQNHDTVNQYHDTVDQNCVIADQYQGRSDGKVDQKLHKVTSIVAQPSLPHPSPQIGRTPKSTHRSKISLAIQFKGVCTPQPVNKNRDSIKTQAADNLSLCDADTTPRKRCTNPTVKEDTNPSLVLTPPVTAKEQSVVHQVIESLPSLPEEVLDFPGDSASPQAVLTQVSDLAEDKFAVENNLHVSLSLSDSDRFEEINSKALPEDLKGLPCNQSHIQCGITSVPPVDDVPYLNDEAESKDKDKEERKDGYISEAIGMSRSDAEIEESIAAYQRSTHRNRMELERIQRKNRAMKETLSSDLAEQIEENDNNLLDDMTEDRTSIMERVIDIQLELAIQSQAIEENRYDSVLDEGSRLMKQDGLTFKELKCEIESLESENLLMLSKKQTNFLITKSSTTL